MQFLDAETNADLRLICSHYNTSLSKLTNAMNAKNISSKRLAVVCSLALTSGAVQAVGVTGFGSAQWGATDATLGVAGYAIEDFEDAALAAGLNVLVQSPSLGGYGPTATLPCTYSAAQDCCSGAFNGTLMWDGTKGLVNRPFVPITTYGNDGGWSDVSFLFPGGVSSLGFSYGQAEINIIITLDLGGGQTAAFNSTTYVGASGGRNGYLRFDAGAGETIYGIKLDNQSNNHDGILYDHLAFLPVPTGVPDAGSTAAALSLAFLGLAVFRRSGA